MIDGPLGPQTEAEIIKRENNELKQELSELRKTMLRQEQSYNKKIGNTRQDPVEDWKKGQIDKLHRQLAEAEQRVGFKEKISILTRRSFDTSYRPYFSILVIGNLLQF